MRFSPDWELDTIPFEAIPEQLLKHWWSLRTNAIKGKKQTDPKTRARLDQKAASMRRLRAKQKKE